MRDGDCFLSGRWFVCRASRMVWVWCLVAVVAFSPVVAAQGWATLDVRGGAGTASRRIPLFAGKPPADLAPLIKAGNVTIAFHDPKQAQDIGAGGRARFHFKTHEKYRYSYKWNRRDGKLLLDVTPAVTDVDMELTHTIKIPIHYNRRGMWNRRLVRHEFDHVAISTDPRAYLLLKHLFLQMGTIHGEFDDTDQDKEELVCKLLKDEIDRRRDAVRKLIGDNYKLLDDVSAHGKRRIGHRIDFFKRLYTKENLHEMKFPYLPEVLDVLESEEYAKARLYYSARPIMP